jgi:hypothetical protein
MKCDVTIRYQNEVWYYCNEMASLKYTKYSKNKMYSPKTLALSPSPKALALNLSPKNSRVIILDGLGFR